MSKTIVSYNVNGIRAAIKKGFIEWLKEGQFDIVCVQETKARYEQVDLSLFEELGYQSCWFSAEKKGYSGVATFSKIAPSNIVNGCQIQVFDCEGRVLRTDFDDLTILNCYFPSGTSGDNRQALKIQFLDDIYQFAHELKKERPNLILLGDYNIAHNEIDLHNPKANKNTTGFLPEERAWMTKWFDSGFTDAFRYKYPEEIQYSWWSYRAGARGKNKGWRLDYQSVSDNLKDKIVEARQLTDVVHSDHCPVFLELDI